MQKVVRYNHFSACRQQGVVLVLSHGQGLLLMETSAIGCNTVIYKFNINGEFRNTNPSISTTNIMAKVVEVFQKSSNQQFLSSNV